MDYDTVGLSDFGKPHDFYKRQIKTLSKVSSLQAETRDVDTNDLVGKIPHFEDIVAFFDNSAFQPADRNALIHGDYKIDNLVYHRTEPRVIGILDWEMSTTGHPLSDLSNLLSPFIFAEHAALASQVGMANMNFQPPHRLEGLPSRDECIEWYAGYAGWDPKPESKWGDAFGVFRNSVIVQGIAARLALRQASSAQAKEHVMRLRPIGEFARTLVQEAKAETLRQGSKL